VLTNGGITGSAWHFSDISPADPHPAWGAVADPWDSAPAHLTQQRAIKVNGQSVPYLRNSRFEAERAQKLLTHAVGWPVSVRPVLVFLTGTLIPDVTIKEQPEHVVILDRTDIPGALKRAEQRLDPEQVETIYRQARRSTTWRRS